MNEVLLLGDSIRWFYHEKVGEYLGSDYHITTPDENGRFAAYTLNSLRFWLKDDYHPDVIHWNNGLWDVATIYPEDGCFTPLEVYLSNLKSIIRVLKKYNVPVIFATSTPVSPGKETLTSPMPPCIHNYDIIRYNAAAVLLMKSEGILIDDLFSVIDGKTEKCISEDMIHPNPEGVDILAKAVAESIISALCDR